MCLLIDHIAIYFSCVSLSTSDSTSVERKTADQENKEFKDVFEGDVGRLEGQQKLKVDPTVTLEISPYRRVAFAVKSKLKSELERLTGLDVLAPVDEPTEWVSTLLWPLRNQES